MSLSHIEPYSVIEKHIPLIIGTLLTIRGGGWSNVYVTAGNTPLASFGLHARPVFFCWHPL